MATKIILPTRSFNRVQRLYDLNWIGEESKDSRQKEKKALINLLLVLIRIGIYKMTQNSIFEILKKIVEEQGQKLVTAILAILVTIFTSTNKLCSKDINEGMTNGKQSFLMQKYWININ